MRNLVLAVIGAFLVVGAVGCGAGAAGSCSGSFPTYSYCVDYVGSGYTTTSAQAACEGTYSSSACPTIPSGVCTVNKGTNAEQRFHFPATDGGSSMESPESICSQARGTYSAN